MIGSGLKKYALENGLKVAQGVGYGSFRGYAATLSEGSGYNPTPDGNDGCQAGPCGIAECYPDLGILSFPAGRSVCPEEMVFSPVQEQIQTDLQAERISGKRYGAIGKGEGTSFCGRCNACACRYLGASEFCRYTISGNQQYNFPFF